MSKEEVYVTTANLKGLATLSEKYWDYITSEELWDFIIVASVKITAILVISWMKDEIGKKIIEKDFAIKKKKH